MAETVAIETAATAKTFIQLNILVSFFS